MLLWVWISLSWNLRSLGYQSPGVDSQHPISTETHTYSPCSRETEAEESKVQNPPKLPRKPEDSLNNKHNGF